jgi:peptidoglycan/LPS O-acetylase OafA/YrhL
MSEAAKRLHYPALDGLRGIAILLVVVYHNFGFINYSSFGWLGVDLFFVLSGFLITDILMNTVGQDGYLKNFYIRRVLRIFPLYYLCLIIFLLILPRFSLLPDSDYYVSNQAWLWTYLQNWLYIFRGNDSTVSLHHLWSLAVEEQFYLVWPLVILIVRKPRVLLVLMVIGLVAVVTLRLWIWLYDVSELSYYKFYTFSRVDGLIIGCMIALIMRIQPQFLRKYSTFIVLFFAIMNFAFFFVNRRYDFGFPYIALAGYTTFAMIFGLLVHEAVTGATPLLNKALSIPPLRFFGRVSYGLYIFHWPLYLILKPRLEPWVTLNINAANASLITSFIATIAAVVLSWFSFRFFESYFLNLKDRFAKNKFR